MKKKVLILLATLVLMIGCLMGCDAVVIEDTAAQKEEYLILFGIHYINT